MIRLNAMALQQRNRGPDEESYCQKDEFNLVFNRLAIVDIESGQQPVFSSDKRYILAMNGEIYNYLELQKSIVNDNENLNRLSEAQTLLMLYIRDGIGFLNSLIGMFSIVIWDNFQKKLILARDRLGIKPLYYYKSESDFVFGSEIKSLLVNNNCPRDVDNLGSLYFKKNRYDYIGDSAIKGIKYIPGGCYVIVQNNNISTYHYWKLSDQFNSNKLDSFSENQLSEQLGDLIENSVKVRLMSDQSVEIGSWLSGGVDSSIITAIYRSNQRDIKAFGVVSSSVEVGEDILRAIKLTNEIGIDFHPVDFSSENFLNQIGFDLEYFEKFIWILDAPHFHLNWLFKYELTKYMKTVSPNLKIILTGEGGDEFCGGYSVQPFYNRIPNCNWEEYESSYLNNSFLKNKNPLKDMRNTYHFEMYLKQFTLQYYNLWFTDRITSSLGTEARVPLLDHRIVEFLASIPVEKHKSLFWNKQIFRNASKKWLPEDITNFKKIGFFHSENMDPIVALQKKISSKITLPIIDKYLSDSSSAELKKSIFSDYKMVKKHSKYVIYLNFLNKLATIVYKSQIINPPVFDFNREGSHLVLLGNKKNDLQFSLDC